MKKNLQVATFLVLLLLCMSLLVVSGVAADRKPNLAFRCFRPFGALSAFRPGVMRGSENCIFDFFSVSDAKATPKCTGPAHGESHGECKVKVSLDGRRVRRMLDDTARYTLELRAVNDSTINYKGFDGNGYSMCCMFLDGARCEWQEDGKAPPASETTDPPADGSGDVAAADEPAAVKKHRISNCPLQDGEQGADPVDIPLSGSITKPLHTYQKGEYEAKLTFYNKHEVAGKLSIRFDLTDDDMSILKGDSQQAKVVQETDATAASHEHGEGSALVAVEKKTGDDEAKPKAATRTKDEKKDL